MALALNPEQKLLQASVERFFRDEYPFEKRRQILAAPPGFDAAVWQQFADFGWLAAPFPEEDGGIGGGLKEAVIVMEGVGRSLAVEPYMPNVVLAGGLLSLLGNDRQKSLLQDMMEGRRRLALAFAEPQSRYVLHDCATLATRKREGFVLDGRKSVVLGGATADTVIVVARTAGEQRDMHGLSLFLVPSDAEGVSVRAYPTIDGLQACDLLLEQVYLQESCLLGSLHEGLAPIESVVDAGIAAISAEAVGAMSALFDLTLDYLKTRKQFGRTLGSNQALQHRMVDMHIALEETKALLGHGINCLDQPASEMRTKALSALKIQAGRAGRMMGQEAVQMHGAIGVTDECPVSHYFKRLTMIDLTFGNVSWHEQRFAAI